jgi:nucleoside 2-deoxyribosyltransferase
VAAKPSVYVASPLGFALPSRIFYARTLLPALRGNGLQISDPWHVSDIDRALMNPSGTLSQRTEALTDFNRRVGRRNERMIRACNGVFAVLDGSDVDSGTASEIGFAAALGKPIVGWRSDMRLTGDNEASIVNLQVAYFVLRTGGVVTRDLDAAITALVERLAAS